MKFTLSWLREYLETEATLDEIVDTLNRIGLEVESIVDRARELKDFRCVLVEEVEKHPNSDHLHICRVRTAGVDSPLTVVCGAPNVRAGMKSLFASVGSVLPGKEALAIGMARIRGVDSSGMLCSERELGLGDEDRGIVELDGNTRIGAQAADIYGLSDPILEIAITPNRGDCLGVYGLARDLAAAGVGRLRKLKKPSFRASSGARHGLGLATGNCPMFLFREIENIKNCSSPEWLAARLRSVGLSPRNAIVDIGNYVMFSLGKPLHFYDLASLEGDLLVRDAEEGEIFTDLFGNEHRLPAGAVVITDGRKILCLGGIIGASSSSIGEETRGVLLESAIFDPLATARTAKLLNIRSDAGYRFERGSDYGMVSFALDYGTDLVRRICGGSASEIVSQEREGYRESLARNVRLVYGQIEKRLGLRIARKDVTRILKSLGYGLTGGTGGRSSETLVLTTPPFRSGIDCAEEVIDDLIRIYGYDNLLDDDFIDPKVYGKEANGFQRKFEDNLHRIRKRLVSNGMTELITYSFLRKKDSAYFSEVNDDLDLINPITSDFSHLRQNMIPNILNVLVKNCSRGFDSLSFFEIGHVYRECALDREDNVVCGVRYGNHGTRDCHGRVREFDIFDVKKDIFDVLAIFGLDGRATVRREAPGYYHPGRSGALVGEDGTTLGYFGELHPALVPEFSLRNRPLIFEFFVDRVPKEAMVGTCQRRASNFVQNDLQPVLRDFSFILEENREVGDLIRDLAEVNRSLISRVSLFDIYSCGEGKKSVGLEVEIQPQGKTLGKEEIDALASALVELVASKYGGILRDR
ncbi:MAG: phenylalanine--tRNA ligase subunit beta [Rickettsiales bacterium]|jgi:phenylalanyl-tRNA synthetase beta chain|nr:phenylalanine--tRNA ligase subunit beta [Rickettsiales bacterium]